MKLAAVAAVAVCVAQAATPPKGVIDANHYKETVKYLASDEMRGRGTGSPQLEKAAKYIADQFKKLGIKPASAQGYFQYFEVTTNAKLGKGNELKATVNGTATAAVLGQEFNPLNFSSNTAVTAPVVFVGYGITAPEYDYDDYTGVDVKGKIVMLLRHEPQEFDEKSKFAGKAYTSHMSPSIKAVNAKFHGAKAVVFVNDVSNHTDADAVEKFSSNVGPNSPDIPFVQVKAELAERWLQGSGTTLKQWIEQVDKDLKPRPVELKGVELALAVNVQKEERRVQNVAAYIPGETDEYVILGAHYDHLGMGEQSSMAPELAGKAIHHGADDNASGTAGLLELAGYLAGQPKAKRGILLLAFSAEELGLIGSSHYVNHPILPLEKAAVMINMDMIGRIKDNKLYVGGTGTGSTLGKILDGNKALAGNLQLDLSEQGGYGSSDHFSFTTKQVPVLFFFSGLHSDYHKPSDTWEKINAESAASLLKLVAGVTMEAAKAAEKPAYIKVSTPQQQAQASASPSGGGAWFGSVPDMGETKGGFKLSDVTKGSPADEAGLKGGDLITEFDGKVISNLYDFTYALRAKKAGDEVTIKYKRGAEEFTTKCTLKSRNARR